MCMWYFWFKRIVTGFLFGTDPYIPINLQLFVSMANWEHSGMWNLGEKFQFSSNSIIVQI